MVEVIGVRFRTNGKIYYFSPEKFNVNTGDHVIVETVRGVEYGTVVMGRRKIGEKDVVSTLKPIIRVATPKDDAQQERNKKKCKEAFDICLKKIEKHKLQMKLIDVEYTFDNNKLLFYFSADGRVDFRELVRDLANEFRTRIELRQIGVRDEAKLLGGIGICGRPLCCYTHLSEFASVSIKMAKEQNLSLNPSKISGVCGRLMCCLKNEQETYEYLNSKLPHVGDFVKAKDGYSGEVQSVSVLRQKVKVIITNEDDEKEVMEYKVEDLSFTPRRKKGNKNNTLPPEEDVDMKELESLEKEDQTQSKLE
ncbi:MAG: stage 0 sporulation family protein [Lachnospiraceae bacterium]|nr:stage 0 sporulation family protein [Lachnospiraceae bacterium]